VPLNHALHKEFIPLMLMPEDLLEIIDHDLRDDDCLVGIGASFARLFGAHESGTEANGKVARTHLDLLHRDDVAAHEVNDEHKSV
jgi:predicted transcriptional regulator YheO